MINLYVLGYENKDWYIPSPALSKEVVDTASLSKEYIRETLNYFRKYLDFDFKQNSI